VQQQQLILDVFDPTSIELSKMKYLMGVHAHGICDAHEPNALATNKVELLQG
jgi:hypothetical protein